MPAVADRVKETTTTTGTGTLTLGGAATGYQTFSTAFGNAASVYYVIAGGSEWEVGVGTTGSGTLSRDTVLASSNSNALVPFSAGTKDVFCAYPASRAVMTSDAATLTNKTISGSSNTLSNIGNSSLTNSAVTVNGTSISLGASGTVTAAAGTLTGTTLNSTVVSSSLTSVGTLASLTVTGDVTVDTNTLKVDSTNNRVGVVNATPSYPLDVTGDVNLSTGSVFRINGTSVLSGTTLGSGVTGSSLTSVGTLASLTVTGDVTVDTSTLKVDSTNNRVGIVTASPSHPLHVVGTSYLQQVIERATVSATAATGTIAYDALTQAVLYYTSNASANWTVNFRGSSGTTLATLLAVGDSITLTFLVTQGATAYYASAHQIDGSSVTPKWQGGTAPTAGNASGIDIYTYTIIKTAATPTYTVLASQTKFT